MRSLVLGGSGLLGRHLVLDLMHSGEVSFTYFTNPHPIPGAQGHKLDLKDEKGLEGLIDEADPDIIFHAVAPPSVDWHEKERAAAYQINVSSTSIIAERSRDMGAKLVYVSTAFVFPDLEKIFNEDDIPAPINFYGATKLGGELASKQNPDHLIIRTDQIYGWSLPGQKKSFVVNTLDKLMRKEKVEVCRDWLNSPTYVKDLSEAILALTDQKKRGIYHVVGSSFLDRVSWATKIAVAFGQDASLIKGIDSSSMNLSARRPNARISSEKVGREEGISLKTVEEGIEAMRRDRT